MAKSYYITDYRCYLWYRLDAKKLEYPELGNVLIRTWELLPLGLYELPLQLVLDSADF